MTGLIVCSGTINDYSFYSKYFEKANIIICADGGAKHLKKFDVLPQILLGDFDSIDKADLKTLIDSGVEVCEYPIEKDMTDTALAVHVAKERGCDEIIIIGGIGTRLDHSMANIYLLKKMLEMGITGLVVDENNEIRLIANSIELQREEGYKVSLLPITEVVEGVNTQGLYYKLKNACLRIGDSLGVSNEFSEDIAMISIESGLLLVLKSKDS